jgi:hypothetical protein
MRLRFGASTDVGRMRTNNEDSYLSETPVAAVADGMGGHRAGEVASAIAMEELAALRDVSVDPRQVEQTAPNRVEIPPAPPYSTAPETDPPVVLEHDGTNWYVVQ